MFIRKWFGVLSIVALLSCGVGSSAGAYSDSTTYNVPNVAGHKIQSNCWLSNTSTYSTHQFKVSAKLVGTQSPKWIKTAWYYKASGISVSVGGVSGSSGGNSFSGKWTNTKGQKNSSHSGAFKLSGIPLTGSLSNTASVLVKGVTASASASCSRFY